MLEDYLLPTTVEAALGMLQQHGGQAKLIAGGTDLVLMEEKAANKAMVLVDISRIAALRTITHEGDMLRIGAGVTHTEIATSPLVQEYAPALATACGVVGGKQIRNIATLGGNIVTAQPAADGAVAAAALGATCVVRHISGSTQEVPLVSLYAGVGKSLVNPAAQLLTHIHIPLQGKHSGSSYQRMQQRKALSLPMLCVAAHVVVTQGTIASASIVYAPVAPGPRHASEAEAFLCGKKAEDATFAAAADLAAQHATFRSSPVRGSQEFRAQVFPVCIRRALREACNCALDAKA